MQAVIPNDTKKRTLLSLGNRGVGNDDGADIGGLGNGAEVDDANASAADDADLDLLVLRSRIGHGEGRAGAEGGGRRGRGGKGLRRGRAGEEEEGGEAHRCRQKRWRRYEGEFRRSFRRAMSPKHPCPGQLEGIFQLIERVEVSRVSPFV